MVIRKSSCHPLLALRGSGLSTLLTGAIVSIVTGGFGGFGAASAEPLEIRTKATTAQNASLALGCMAGSPPRPFFGGPLRKRVAPQRVFRKHRARAITPGCNAASVAGPPPAD